MSDVTDIAREIYTTGLRNQHAVENQAVELLERQLGRLENYPEMSDRIRLHIKESQDQAHRIEELLSGLGTSHSAMKDTVMSFVGNMAALAHTPAPDEVVKNTFANYAFEHFEMAAYKSLLALAEATGHTTAIAPLKQSLGEEEAMAQWIDDHIGPTTLTYLQRSASGMTAGR